MAEAIQEVTPAPTPSPEPTPNSGTTPNSPTPPTNTAEPAPAAAAEEPTLFTSDDLESIELPEGYTLDKDDVLTKEFIDLINDPASKENLPQKMVALHAKVLESNMNQWLKTQDDWVKELETEYGSKEALERELAPLSKTINDYASGFGDKAEEIGQSLRAQFDTTGAGNNPHIVRFLIWTAGQLSEGGPLSGDSTGGERSRAERMFGT